MMTIQGLQEQAVKLDLLYEVGKKVETEQQLSKLLDEIMQMAQHTLEAEASSVLLIEEKSGELLFEVAKGRVGERVKHLKISMQRGITGWVASHGQPMMVNDVTKGGRFNKSIDDCTGFKTRSIICAPLIESGKPIGVLE